VKELRDPSDFFRPLKETRPPEEFWVGFWPSVRSGIREAELTRRPMLTPVGALLLGSSAGVMVAAAVLVLGFLVVPALRVAPPSVPYPASALKASVSHSEDRTSPPVLEELSSASARVYTFHVGEKADATDVILIVDESIDI
jgi:hypothetical protein